MASHFKGYIVFKPEPELGAVKYISMAVDKMHYSSILLTAACSPI